MSRRVLGDLTELLPTPNPLPVLPSRLASVPDAELMRVDATPDRTVWWFALGLTAATALAFGLVPALRAASTPGKFPRRPAGDWFNEGSRYGARGPQSAGPNGEDRTLAGAGRQG